MTVSFRALPGAVLLALAAASAAGAQGVLDWTVRTSAGAEALEPGAPAVFTNPAAIGLMASRGEGMLLRLDTPDAIDLNGLAASGALRLRRGAVLGVGYQHLGIADIERTSVSPVDGEGTFQVAEDRISLAAAQPLSPSVWAGALAEYVRSDAGVGATSDVLFGLGAAAQLAGGLRPTIGGSALIGQDGTRWSAGIAASPPGMGTLPVALRASYGITGQTARSLAPEHRLAIGGSWRNQLGAMVGVAASASGGAMDWAPVAQADLRLGRYLLGVLREGLANEFGAAYLFHFNVRW
ncbi:MAG TPA: hypothetical protein VFQ38_01445 [Longimicrobiales bacterium]|nr:hypothetical protein [Longimicrobiales bacterium]